MKFSLFIGLRYLFTKRKDSFVSMMSRFSFLGIVLGVVSLIVVLSVMNGFHAELRKRILTLVPHAFVEYTKASSASHWKDLRNQLEKNKLVLASAPFIKGQALTSIKGAAQGVTLNGVLPIFEKTVSIVDQYMKYGQLNSLVAGEYKIVIGSGLARALNVDIGDLLKVSVPKVSVTPGGIFPRMRSFEVSGIFEVGAQLDHDQAFIHLKDAQILYRLRQDAQGLRVHLTEVFSVDKFSKSLNLNQSERYKVTTWKQVNSSLFSAIQMEKTMVSVLLAVVVGVAAFNIISILSMMISNKKSEIAVLRTMGASSRGILLIFLSYGLGMAVLGVIIGTLIGLPIAYFIGDIVQWVERLAGVEVFDASIYYISKIPSEIHWQDILGINVLTFCLIFIASVYPAYKASQIEPAQALHYE